jgi:polyribonucleotide nucleotidyltransferase
VAAVRIGQKNGNTIINPTYAERDAASMDVLACGKDGTINMIEVGALQASEEDVASAFGLAVEEHNKILAWQKQIIQEIGKPKRDATKPELPAALTELYKNEFASKLTPAVFCGVANKDSIHALQDAWMAKIGESEELKPLKGAAKRFLEDKVDEEIHRGAIEDNKRADGRGFADLRPLYAKAGGISPILHGSGVFYRGGTHVFTALTLGGPGDSQLIDSMEEQDKKQRFMHHYNFPPYSAGETGRMGGINRRAVGHGALAQKALEAVLPPAETFPYTIRLVSECMASNGSTSMGSACASTLALMEDRKSTRLNSSHQI